MASTGAMVAAGDRKVSWQAVWSPDALPSVTDQSADAAARAQQFAAFAERMEEGLCRLAAAAITKRALDNVKKRLAEEAANPVQTQPPAPPAPKAKTAAVVPPKEKKAVAPKPAWSRPRVSERALAFALAALGFLLLLLLVRYLLANPPDLLDDGCRALATTSTRLFGALMAGLRGLLPHAVVKSAYDGVGAMPATCGAKCGGDASATCGVPAALDAELRAARASSAAAAQVHVELEAARSAAASAAKVKADLEAARASAAAAASLQSQLDSVQAELKAARAQAAQSAKVQAELDAARSAAAQAAQVQAELQAAAAAARVQADLDAARGELDAARQAAAQAARMKAELQLASSAQATSAQVQAELQAARAVAEAAQRLQAELDAVRAAQAASANAEAVLDAAAESQRQEARLRAELSAAKMATCASKKVQSQLDEVTAVSTAALATQQELIAAKQELEEARRAAASAQAVRTGLERARSGAAVEMRYRAPVIEEVAVNGTQTRTSWPFFAVPSPSARPAAVVDWWLRMDTLGAVALALLLCASLLTKRSTSSGDNAAMDADDVPPAARAVRGRDAAASAPPPVTVSHCFGWVSLLRLADAPAGTAPLSTSQRKACVTARTAASQRRSAVGDESARLAIARAAARSRATRLLCAMAGKGSDMSSVVLSLDALRRLSQDDAGACRALSSGAIAAALGALLAFPTSVDVAWHACTLLGNIALCPVLQARVMAHPEVQSGRALVLVIKALMLHGTDARLAAATTGAMWTLLLAGGPNGCVLASRAGAPRLLLGAVSGHQANGVVVYNAAGALLTLAQSSVDVRAQLDTQQRTQLRDALLSHGGLDTLYGPEVAGAARAWLGA